MNDNDATTPDTAAHPTVPNTPDTTNPATVNPAIPNTDVNPDANPDASVTAAQPVSGTDNDDTEDSSNDR